MMKIHRAVCIQCEKKGMTLDRLLNSRGISWTDDIVYPLLLSNYIHKRQDQIISELRRIRDEDE